MQNRAGQAVNVTDWSMFYSFDVVGEVGFSKDFGNLTTGVEHSAIKPIHEHIKVFGVLSPIPWLMNVLGSIPGAANIYTEIFDICANEIRAKQKVCTMTAPQTLEVFGVVSKLTNCPYRCGIARSTPRI